MTMAHDPFGVGHANQQIKRILHHIDHVLTQYQQDSYYESPEFHISLASVKGNLLNDIDSDQMPKSFHSSLHDGDTDDDDNDDDDDGVGPPLILTIDHVYCTFGTTKSYKIDLLTA